VTSNHTTRLILLAAGFVLVPSLAMAQAKPERVVLGINETYQAGTSEVSSTVGFTANLEKGTFAYQFPVKQGPAIDVSGRIRLFNNFGLGVAYTSFSASGTTAITGQVPHPFFFSQMRSIAGQASLDREETALHVRATFSSSPGKKLQFTVFGGAAFFTVKQGLVDRVSYTESYPYDTAAFGTATTHQESLSKMGFGAGADVAYYFTKNVGIGAVASIAKATIDATASDSSTVSINVGGSSMGLGLRLRF